MSFGRCVLMGGRGCGATAVSNDRKLGGPYVMFMDGVCMAKRVYITGLNKK